MSVQVWLSERNLHLYHELLTKPFQKYDDTEELFVFIYDVGAHANWVNEYILQGSFDERLALDPMKYCIHMGYDALSLAKDYEDLHNNLYCVDVDYPTKKEILAYFEVVEKALRGLRNAVNLRQSEIEVQLESAFCGDQRPVVRSTSGRYFKGILASMVKAKAGAYAPH